MSDNSKKDHILQEDHGGASPGAGFYAGQQTEKPKKYISPWLAFFIGFIGFIIGLVVGAMIN